MKNVKFTNNVLLYSEWSLFSFLDFPFISTNGHMWTVTRLFCIFKITIYSFVFSKMLVIIIHSRNYPIFNYKWIWKEIKALCFLKNFVRDMHFLNWNMFAVALFHLPCLSTEKAIDTNFIISHGSHDFWTQKTQRSMKMMKNKQNKTKKALSFSTFASSYWS